MEVSIEYRKDAYSESLHEYESIGAKLGDKQVFISVCNLNECPEDAILSRSIPSVYQMYNLAMLFYEAGKQGVEIKLTELEDVC